MAEYVAAAPDLPPLEERVAALARSWQVQHGLRDALQTDDNVPPLVIKQQPQGGRAATLFSPADIRTAAALSGELYDRNALSGADLLQALRSELHLHESAEVSAGLLAQGADLRCGWFCCTTVRRRKELFIAWRGTQDLKDLFTNLDWRPRRIPGVEGVRAHAGFWGIFDEVKGDLGALLRELKPDRVVFCGHSLGGGVAVAAHFATLAVEPASGEAWAWWHARRTPVAVQALTFAAPSALVFDDTTSEPAVALRERLTASAANLFFEWDAVPRLPACREFALAALRSCARAEEGRLALPQRLYLRAGGLSERVVGLLERTAMAEPELQRYAHASRLFMCSAEHLDVTSWARTGGWWEWRELNDGELRGLPFPGEPGHALDVALKDHLLLPFRYCADWRGDHCHICHSCVQPARNKFVDCHGCQASFCDGCFQESSEQQPWHEEPGQGIQVHEREVRESALYPGRRARLPEPPKYLNFAELTEQRLKTERLAMASIGNAWNLCLAAQSWESSALAGSVDYQRLKEATIWADGIAKRCADSMGKPGKVRVFDRLPFEEGAVCLREEAVENLGARLSQCQAARDKALQQLEKECMPGIKEALAAARAPHEMAKYCVKANLAWNLFFSAGEVLYSCYLSWGDGRMNWDALAARISGIALKTAAKIGATYVGAYTGAFVGGLINPVLAPLGAAAGCFVAQALAEWAAQGWGEHLYLKVRGKEGSDDTDAFNREAVIQAMLALQLDGSYGGAAYDPYTLGGRALKEKFHTLIRNVHPDKVHRGEGESSSSFDERRINNEATAKLFIHHYQLLSVFVTKRDSTQYWIQQKAGMLSQFECRRREHRRAIGLGGA